MFKCDCIMKLLSCKQFFLMFFSTNEIRVLPYISWENEGEAGR
jgi:hypothetical protein